MPRQVSECSRSVGPFSFRQTETHIQFGSKLRMASLKDGACIGAHSLVSSTGDLDKASGGACHRANFEEKRPNPRTQHDRSSKSVWATCNPREETRPLGRVVEGRGAVERGQVGGPSRRLFQAFLQRPDPAHAGPTSRFPPQSQVRPRPPPCLADSLTRQQYAQPSLSIMIAACALVAHRCQLEGAR